MVIAAVDPNKKDLAKLVRYLRMVFHGCEVVMFSDPAFAEQYIKDNPIDVLFTEIPMLGLTGLRLQVKCEAVQPDNAATQGKIAKIGFLLSVTEA